MNHLAEKLTVWFGSTPFIFFHALWFNLWTLAHLLLNLDPEWNILTIIVSLEAIFLALFVLRGQNVQAERQETYIKQAARDTKKDLRLGQQILKELHDQRYMK